MTKEEQNEFDRERSRLEAAIDTTPGLQERKVLLRELLALLEREKQRLLAAINELKAAA